MPTFRGAICFEIWSGVADIRDIHVEIRGEHNIHAILRSVQCFEFCGQDDIKERKLTKTH